METAARLSTVVLDKTGTVTEGRPKVLEIVPLADVNSATLLAAAAAAEQLSDHPLARSIVEEAEGRGMDVPRADALQVIAGEGIQASMDGRTVRVGNARLLESASIDTSLLSGVIQKIQQRGQSALGSGNQRSPTGCDRYR